MECSSQAKCGAHVRGNFVILTSTITCPRCGHRAIEQMPVDVCQFFYDCKCCGERLVTVVYSVRTDRFLVRRYNLTAVANPGRTSGATIVYRNPQSRSNRVHHFSRALSRAFIC